MLDPIKNLLKSPLLDLMYVVEPSDWSIKWDGIYLTENLNNAGLLKSDITTSRRFLKSKIIHFGSVGTFIDDEGIKFSKSKESKIVLTWFHVAEEDPRNKFAKELNEKVDFVHTSCELTKRELMNLGVDESKIVVIPLGVDLEKFKPVSSEEKTQIKKEIGVPEGKYVIGSFQKDGNGWGEGNEPKLIKGPDIFCDVVEKVANEIDVHVLLTGPARGYVKRRLEKSKISYTHKFLENYLDIVRYYSVLDLYLISSRAEGGPKAILESMACGVPIVSTKVGMALDWIKNREKGMICEVGDVECLARKIILVENNIKLKEELIGNSLKTVKELDIRKIVRVYHDLIYRGLLNQINKG